MKLGIRKRVLLVALVPALVLSLFMLSYFVASRLDAAEENLKGRGLSFAHQLATMSEYAVFSGNLAYLRFPGISVQIKEDADIRSAVIRDASGLVLMTYGETDVHLGEINRIDELTKSYLTARGTILIHQPIELTAVAVSDFEEDSRGGQSGSAPNSPMLGWVTVEMSMEALRAEQQGIVLRAVAFLVGGLLLSGWVAHRMGRSVVEPILSLTGAVRRIESGDLSTRVPLSAEGELLELESGINQMTTALQDAQERLQEQVQNATEGLRNSLEALAVQESRYRELVQNANSLIMKLDPEGRILYINPYAEQFLGVASDHLLGREVLGAIFPREAASVVNAMVTQPEKALIPDDITITQDRRRVYVTWYNRPVLDIDGRLVDIICIGHDITERRNIEIAMELLASASGIDTQVFNAIAQSTQVGLDATAALVIARQQQGDLVSLGYWERNQGALSNAFEASIAEVLCIADQEDLALFDDSHIALIEHRQFIEQNLIASIAIEKVADCEYPDALWVLSWDSKPISMTPARQAFLHLVSRRAAIEMGRIQAERELAETRDQALMASRAKSEFLANMSHEIRTPMNAIVGFTNLLLRSRLTREQQNYVSTVRKSAHNLLAIINDVLDLSKIESGKLTIDSVPFDLRECVEDAVSLLAPSAAEKNLELVTMIYSDVPCQLIGDPIRVRQVLINLVGNAVKFTQEGTVVVRVMLEEGGGGEVILQFRVSDTGIGLSEEDQGRLFTAFTQADTSETRRFGGTGLGLAISKKLVEQMKGAVGMESTLGAGSSFWFTLPFKLDLNTQPSVPFTPNPIAGLRALVLDRHSLSRLATRHTLESFDIEVEEASDLEEARRALRQYRGKNGTCDVVILGMGKEQLDPAQCVALRSAMGGESPTPIVVLSSAPGHEDTHHRHQEYATLCLSKPIRTDQLYYRLCNLLAPATKSIRLVVEGGAPKDPTHAPPRYSGLHVLVVEDNLINARLFVILLRDAGMEVTHVETGAEAVELTKQKLFDLIIMDIHMPEMSGLQATELIRSNEPPGRRIPIIALTANAQPDERDRVLQAGMDEFLAKPVEEALLWQTIDRLLLHGGPTVLARGTGDVKPSAVTRDAIAASRTSGGNASLSEELFAMLLEQLPHHRARIERLWEMKDWTELKEEVHKLRGSAAYCALPGLLDATQRLEEDLDHKLGESVYHRRLLVVHHEIERLLATHTLTTPPPDTPVA